MRREGAFIKTTAVGNLNTTHTHSHTLTLMHPVTHSQKHSHTRAFTLSLIYIHTCTHKHAHMPPFTHTHTLAICAFLIPHLDLHFCPL